MKTPIHGLIAGATLFAGAALAEINLSDGDLPDLSISGWVDFAYQSASYEGGAAIGPAPGDADYLGLNEIELNFMFDFGNGLSAKVDIQSVDVTQGNDGFGAGLSAVELEEAYFSYDFLDGEDTSLSLTAGRFFSRFGYEAYDLTGLYQFSLGYTANPQNLQEGLKLDYASDMFSVGVSVVDGLAANAIDNDTDELAYEIGAGFTGVENLTVWAGYAMESDVSVGAVTDDVEVFNVWASYQIGDLLIGAEYADMDAGLNGDAESFLVMANYAVNDWLGFTARYSQLDTGAVTTDEYTLAALFTVHDNLGVIVEYRMDETEAPGGDLDGDSIAIEATLTF